MNNNKKKQYRNRKNLFLFVIIRDYFSSCRDVSVVDEIQLALKRGLL
jgi:hypothetical protein